MKTFYANLSPPQAISAASATGGSHPGLHTVAIQDVPLDVVTLINAAVARTFPGEPAIQWFEHEQKAAANTEVPVDQAEPAKGDTDEASPPW